ncbi:response regulator [Nitrospira sp. NS4]|uniref:response regulator n=1 Tax=Nitrospira sp. NS4 TaxID=3414498 RepID=UPI003C2EF780
MAGQRKTVLVAEDHESSRTMLALLLEQAQYEVCLAGDGHEALEHMLKAIFDAVITDWDMPRVNGSELLIISRILWPGTPVIIVSAQAAPSAEGIPRGAFAWLTKPYQSNDLLQILQAAVDTSAQERWQQPVTTTFL